MSDPRVSCEFMYPATPEGEGYSSRMHAPGGVVTGVSPTLASGSWFDVVIQWLPDGRCAVLVDGALVGISQTIQPGRSARVVMWGNSVGTDVLLGPLEVWRGVVPEVASAMRRKFGK